VNICILKSPKQTSFQRFAFTTRLKINNKLLDGVNIVLILVNIQSRSVICQVDLQDTDKSQNIVITEFNNCFTRQLREVNWHFSQRSVVKITYNVCQVLYP